MQGGGASCWRACAVVLCAQRHALRQHHRPNLNTHTVALCYMSLALLIVDCWLPLLLCFYGCREVGRRAGVPVQEFCVRNDMPCGSTIGPILAHNLGCRTVDVGMPQLSMHSIREMAGVDDVLLAYKHFLAFFRWAGCWWWCWFLGCVASSASCSSCVFSHSAGHVGERCSASGRWRGWMMCCWPTSTSWHSSGGLVCGWWFWFFGLCC
jgi:hypothetical protein